MRKIRLTRASSGKLQSQLDQDLNDAQRQAATAPDGWNLILAGPGSGKTRVITYRVAHLIEKGVAPESIMLVTFTRRAASEMISRLDALVGPRASRVWAGTFHSISNRLLRRKDLAEALGFGSNFTILDTEDTIETLRLAMEDMGLSTGGMSALRPAAVQSLFSFSFNTGQSLQDVANKRHHEMVPFLTHIEALARVFAARKRASNCMDYDDLLGQWARLIHDFPDLRDSLSKQFLHILVDEMQDTNYVQIALIEALAKAGPGNLTAVGDDSQSIYKFRGANYDNILKFPERNPTANVFRLETNYRSTPEIVAFTNASIAHNEQGFKKTLVSSRSEGLKPLVITTEDPYEESRVVCQLIHEEIDQGTTLNKIAVLYRNHHDSILLQGDLVAYGIRYVVRSGLRFFEQAHIKDVLGYLRIVANARDESAWRRTLMLLPGIGRAKASVLIEHLLRSVNPMEAIAKGDTMALVPNKSKGMFAAFVSDLRKVRASNPEANPSQAIAAVMQGGYREIVGSKYDNAVQRIKDLEQLSALAAKYDSLERMLGDLLLAGDVYGMDTVDQEHSGESLVLSSIHQAKGLEWSKVFVIRLVEDSFPNARALEEEDGVEEERRIFYVSITRAKDELILTHPRVIAKGMRAPMTRSYMSRFLGEIPRELYEEGSIEN